MGKNSIYEALKNEQTSRINFRDTALYLQLASSTTATGLYLEFASTTVLLLVVVSSFVFSTLYFVNDFFVSRIGAFLRAFDSPYRDWETFHRVGFGYRLQKWMRRVLVALTFVGGPIAAFWFLIEELSEIWALIGIAIVLLPTMVGWCAAKLHPRAIMTPIDPTEAGEGPTHRIEAG